MSNKITALAGLAGLGTTIGALVGAGLGALAGLGVTIFFFVNTILPWAHDQVVNAPEWYWVAITMGLVPTGIVLIIALVVGAIVGAVVVGLVALLLTGGAAALISGSRKA